MACSFRNVAKYLIGQASNRTHCFNRHVYPTSCYLLKPSGCQTTEYQQCRTKKTFTLYKFNKPVKFDNSGDLSEQIELEPDTVLYKYRDIPEIETLSDELKKLFTVEYASAQEVMEHRHMEVQEKMLNELGPGQNLEKQIAYLTVKIRNLIQRNPKGRANKFEKVHLLERIAKRNKFLGYLRQLDFERYTWIQKELDIRYIPFDKFTYHRSGRKAPRKKAARDEMIGEIQYKYSRCVAQFNKELSELERQKAVIMEEIKQYKIDGKQVADQLLKDLKIKHDSTRGQKLSPKFREYEEEKKRKKLKDSYVF